MSSVAERLAKKSRTTTKSKQVRLRLVHIDFWSAVKLSFLVALTIAVVMIVGTLLVYTAVTVTGTFDKVNDLVKSVAGGKSDLNSFLNLGQVMGFVFFASIINTIVLTALGAIIAVLYNLSVKFTGGLLLGFSNN